MTQEDVMKLQKYVAVLENAIIRGIPEELETIKKIILEENERCQ